MKPKKQAKRKAARGLREDAKALVLGGYLTCVHNGCYLGNGAGCGDCTTCRFAKLVLAPSRGKGKVKG